MDKLLKLTFTSLGMAALGVMSPAYSQVKMGSNPATINSNSILELESNNKGLLLSRVALDSTTLPTPLSAHVAGMHVYNTATAHDVQPGTYYNDGAQWVRLANEVTNNVQLFGSGAPAAGCVSGTLYTDTLSTSATLGQQWTCSGGAWKVYKAPNSTPFYLSGSTNDAGSNKTAQIMRHGGIRLMNVAGTTKSTFLPDGGLSLYRSGTAFPVYGGYIDLTNNESQNSKFRIAVRNDLSALALQTGALPRMIMLEDGRIGFNTNTPGSTVHIKGNLLGSSDGEVQGSIGTGTSVKDGYHFFYNNITDVATGAIQSSTDAANLLLSKRTASVGDRFVSFFVGGTVVGTITRVADGIALNKLSDGRLKENITASHYSIDDLMKIKVVDYNFKSDKSKTQLVGFIAQDLHKVYPDAVSEGGADEKVNPWTVDYGKMTPLLVKAIQDQQKEIEMLRSQLTEMNSLKAEVATIKAMLGQGETNNARSAK
jgi:hypothetical protein